MSRARLGKASSAMLAIAALALVGNDAAAAVRDNSCVRVVLAWRETLDCQITERIERLTWSDGFTGSRPRGKWSDIHLNGPCPKYVSELRNWRVSPVRDNRQIVRVRVRYWYADARERATGQPMIEHARYTCERRGGQWRIFSQEWDR